MISVPRPSPRTIVACVAFIVAPAIVVLQPSPTSPTRSCEALRTWARVYEHRASTLEELARFDRAHRVAIFNAVSVDVRAALWRDQLDRFSRFADLSDEQRIFLRDEAQAITAAQYREDSATRRAAARAIWARIAPPVS